MARILIAGCGDLGASLAADFVAKGHMVSAIRRTGSDFPDSVMGITGELTTLKDDQLPDVELIFLIMTPQGRTESAYRSAYYHTAQRLISRYQKQTTLPNVIFVSSTSVYGQNNGEWIDDTTPPSPTTSTAHVLVETEHILSNAFPSTSVRCSGIYGPGRFRLLQKTVAGDAWENNSWTNRIHRDDVVSALIVLAEQVLAGKTLPESVIATDLTPVSMWEVKLWLATSLNVEPAINNTMSFVPESGKRIQGQYLDSLGWKPNYPSYVVGYQTLLVEFQSK